MHDVQVMQIVIAAGETTEKVCMVTPRAKVEDAPDGDMCTAGCEPRVQRCNRQERENAQVYKEF